MPCESGPTVSRSLPSSRLRLWADAVTELDDRPDLQAQAMAALRFSYDLDAPIAQDVAWVRRSLAVVDKVSDPQLQVYILGQAAGVLVVTGDVAWRTPAGSTASAAFRIVPVVSMRHPGLVLIGPNSYP
jgi:hypothetical protein